MPRHTGSLRCDVVAKMSATPIAFLFLLSSLALSTAAPLNSTTTATTTHPRVETKGSSGKVSSFGRQAMLVMGITFPSAFVVGILWCYCMTRMCGIHSGSKSSLTTERVPPSNQRVSTTSHDSFESSIS